MTKYFLNLLALSFSIGLIILLTLVVSKLLDKKYFIKWRYFLWVILSVILLIPIGWKLPINHIKHIENVESIITHDNYSTDSIKFYDVKNIIPLESSEINQEIDIKDSLITPNAFKIIKIVYLIGFVIFLTHQLLVYLIFKRKIFHWGQFIEDRIIIENYQRISDELGLKRKARILKSDNIPTPIMMGILRPTIIMPSKDYNEEEIYYILKHELMHIKRRDLEYKLLVLIANAIHWFNPLVYVMRNTANVDLEICCDRDILKKRDISEKKSYCKVLLSSIEREKYGYTLTTYFIGGKNEMKERFKNIIDSKNKKNGILVLVSILIVVFLVNVFVLEKVEGSDIGKGIAMNIEEKNDNINENIDAVLEEQEEKVSLENNENIAYGIDKEISPEKHKEFRDYVEFMNKNGRKDFENISCDRGFSIFVRIGKFDISYEDELDYKKFDLIEKLPDKYSENNPFYKHWGKDKIAYVEHSLSKCKFTAKSDIPFSAHIYTKEGEMTGCIKAQEENGQYDIRINFADEEYYIILVNEDGQSTENATYSIWR